MKKFLFCVFFIFVSSKTFPQKSEKLKYEFIGVIVLESKNLYSYKLDFNINKDSITGYSYTDLGGVNETKSIIEGVYDNKTNEIYLRERDILYTKSKVNLEEFCFISLEGKLNFNKNKSFLNAKFNGFYPNYTKCAKGKVRLVGKDFAYKKVNKLYKKVANKKKVDSSVKEKLKPEVFLKKFSQTTINSGEDISVFMYANELRLEVWDYGKEDGDVISIQLNDSVILDNYHVKKEKKIIKVKLLEGKNILKIKTIDAGKLDTNTTKIKLYDIRRTYEVLANLHVGLPAQINIYKN